MKDFVHKSSLVLKELRETGINLAIISDSGIVKQSKELDEITDECNQLIAIFHKTVISGKSRK